MKTEIKKILYKFLQDGITSDDAAQQVLDLFSVSNAKRTVCEKHVCVESKVNVGYRVCVNCYALFPIAN